MAFDSATKTHLEKELLPFLDPGARIDLKSVAIRYFLEMTGTKEGRDFISDGDKFIKAIVSLLEDKEKDITRDAYLILINLTADEKISWKIMNADATLMLRLLHKMLQPDFELADQASSIISNATRVQSCACKLAGQILEDNCKASIEDIVNVLCKINFNKKATLHSLGPIMSNLTQVSNVRKRIMDKDRCIIQKLLPFTEYPDSLIRRGGIIGTLKNCCFEYDYHTWLLSDEVDILPRLLLPLAGGEEFDEDDNEKLPIDLQYLPPDKKREEDPDVRAMLIEAVMQLCATKQGRLLIKEKNTYVIMRELDRWEKDPKAKLECRKLIDLLIADEPETGMEELQLVEVPEHLTERFNKEDQDMLEDFKVDLKEDSELKGEDNVDLEEKGKVKD